MLMSLSLYELQLQLYNNYAASRLRASIGLSKMKLVRVRMRYWSMSVVFLYTVTAHILLPVVLHINIIGVLILTVKWHADTSILSGGVEAAGTIAQVVPISLFFTVS